MPRAYIRLDPEFADRKEGYPDGAFTALVMLICGASDYSRRGVFKSERHVRLVLGKRSRWLRYLVDHGDVIARDDGTLYLEGWEEWQEGNWQVAERMARIRARRNEHRNNDRNADHNPAVRRSSTKQLTQQAERNDDYGEKVKTKIAERIARKQG